MTRSSKVAAARLVKLVQKLKLLASGLFFTAIGFGCLLAFGLKGGIDYNLSTLAACLVSLVAAVLAHQGKLEAARALAALSTKF
ncbi:MULTISPECIES: hypothetical protein [Phaeobacter]|uniref:hypothetical protein n=1 Tax=Phaeobacter TaxID=302485 RepID=UPI003A85BE0D